MHRCTPTSWKSNCRPGEFKFIYVSVSEVFQSTGIWYWTTIDMYLFSSPVLLFHGQNGLPLPACVSLPINYYYYFLQSNTMLSHNLTVVSATKVANSFLCIVRTAGLPATLHVMNYCPCSIRRHCLSCSLIRIRRKCTYVGVQGSCQLLHKPYQLKNFGSWHAWRYVASQQCRLENSCIALLIIVLWCIFLPN